MEEGSLAVFFVVFKLLCIHAYYMYIDRYSSYIEICSSFKNLKINIQ